MSSGGGGSWCLSHPGTRWTRLKYIWGPADRTSDPYILAVHGLYTPFGCTSPRSWHSFTNCVELILGSFSSYVDLPCPTVYMQ